MSSRHEQHGNNQCNCNKTATASQSFDELAFERGIWTAGETKICFFMNFIPNIFSSAIDNDEFKLHSLIAKGHLHDKDKSGYTALHYAARNGHLSICLILLDSGIGVNETTHGGATALHRAAMMG